GRPRNRPSLGGDGSERGGGCNHVQCHERVATRPILACSQRQDTGLGQRGVGLEVACPRCLPKPESATLRARAQGGGRTSGSGPLPGNGVSATFGVHRSCSVECNEAHRRRKESVMSTAPDTIVLVHGLWMTPRSWEKWVPYYESKGYKVLTPAYPGFEIEVEALREKPSVIAELTVPEVVDHLGEIIGGLEQPPIIMGHSFGGTLTQLLLDRGFGAAAVTIDSAPTEGVHIQPLSQLKTFFPAFAHPSKRHDAFGFTAEQFHYAFTNTLSEEESQEVYDRYHIPAPANWLWAYGLFA